MNSVVDIPVAFEWKIKFAIDGAVWTIFETNKVVTRIESTASVNALNKLIGMHIHVVLRRLINSGGCVLSVRSLPDKW